MNRTAAPAVRIALIAVLALVGLALALPAVAQWKWRDAQGRITVSDRPPPREVPDRDILVRPAAPPAQRPAAVAPAEGDAAAGEAASTASPAAPAASAAPSALEREVQARRRAAEAESAAKARAQEQKNAELRADNCRRARAHLTTLQSGQRMARTNEKGEREFLDDAARAREVQRANEVIASECR